MHDLAGVLRIGAAAEAQRSREIAHGRILRRIDREHFADALRARDAGQPLHQQGAQALALQFVADRDGTFAAAAPRCQRGVVSSAETDSFATRPISRSSCAC